MAKEVNRYGIAGLGNARQSSIDNQPETVNFLLPDGFKFHMQRIPKMNYFVQSVNLPALEYSEIRQPTRFVDVKHPGNTFTFPNFELSFIVDEDMETFMEIYNWMKSLVAIEDPRPVEVGRDNFCDATLHILNSAKNPNFVVNFKQCFPVSLSGIDFNSAISEPEPIICTASFAYTAYDIENI
tara:strand:- start:18157 stop:18705 length:549 start_codon:yes stop_codon:yes gene_type:complete